MIINKIASLLKNHSNFFLLERRTKCYINPEIKFRIFNEMVKQNSYISMVNSFWLYQTTPKCAVILSTAKVSNLDFGRPEKELNS